MFVKLHYVLLTTIQFYCTKVHSWLRHWYHLNIFRLCCSVQSIEVEHLSGGGSIYIQSDGEHLGFLPRKISNLPAAIEMIYWYKHRSMFQIMYKVAHLLEAIHFSTDLQPPSSLPVLDEKQNERREQPNQDKISGNVWNWFEDSKNLLRKVSLRFCLLPMIRSYFCVVFGLGSSM